MRNHVTAGSRPLQLLVAVCAVLALAAWAAVAAPRAEAAFGIVGFDGGAYQAVPAGSAPGTVGAPETQAGAHPFEVTTTMDFTQRTGPSGSEPDGQVKDIQVDMPVGFVGNPAGMPQCSEADLFGSGGATTCSPDAQIGVLTLSVIGFGGALTDYYSPVYNMAPLPGVAASFGVNVLGILVHMNAQVRPSDHAVTVRIVNINQTLQIVGTTLTLWGVPQAAAHDSQRCLDLQLNADGVIECSSSGGRVRSFPEHASLAPTAFLTNPTSCSGQPLVTTLHADSWVDPSDVKTASFVTHDNATPPNPVAVTGCDRLQFEPTLDATATTRQAGAPTGYTVRLAIPQTGLANPTGLAPAHLKDAVVTLPDGMAINPASADGLDACSDALFGLGTGVAERCPAASRIGSVNLTSPLVDGPLTGGVYLLTQASRDPESGDMFRIGLVLENLDRGVTIKLVGHIRADRGTGRLTATFADNPQLPFSEMTVRFKDGARAPLTTPTRCGTYQTTATLTSWSGRVVHVASPMTIDGGCDQAGRFEPSLSVGTTDPVAGSPSSLVMSFGRPDGQRELGAVNGSLPPGLLGVLKSVPLCSAAQGAAGTCPAASRVGRVQVAAGAGSQPLWMPVAGRPENAVSLTEPYRKGDVAGMSIVVPAVAGPFDLGTVVTKVYLKLRPEDQGIDLQSDRLPRILGGVPLAIRKVAVTVDRKGFMVNPTSCRAMATYANVFSQAWAKVPVTSRFQVGGCASLAFSPIITAQAGGKGDVRRYEHPALKVTVRQPAGQAHLSKTNVVLPKALNIDLKAPALKAACPRDVYAKDQCSPVATVGTVRAVTPLLREPLEGPAFLIQKKGKLPDLVMRLRNNRMSLDLIGVLDFLKDGRLITRVKGIPDAALSSFVLQIKGGKDGSLLNRSALCGKRRLVRSTFKGQNGKLSRKTPLLHVVGCARARTKAKSSARRASQRAVRRARAAAADGAGPVAAGRGAERATGGRS